MRRIAQRSPATNNGSIYPRVHCEFEKQAFGSVTLSLLQMAARLASNGNQSGLENNSDQGKLEDIQMKSEPVDMETNQADSVKAGEYVRELLKEKMSLDPAQYPNAMRLVDQGKLSHTGLSTFLNFTFIRY